MKELDKVSPKVIPIKERVIKSLNNYLGDSPMLRWGIGYDQVTQMFALANSISDYKVSEGEEHLPSPNRLFFEFDNTEVTANYDFFTEDYELLIELAQKAKNSENYEAALNQAILIARKFCDDLKSHPEFNLIVEQLIPKTFFNESSYMKTEEEKKSLLEDMIGAAFLYRVLQIYIPNRPNSNLKEEHYAFLFLTKVLNYLPAFNEGTSQYSQGILCDQLKDFLLKHREQIIKGKKSQEFFTVEKEVTFDFFEIGDHSKEPMKKGGCPKGTGSPKDFAKLLFGQKIENVYLETKEKVPVLIVTDDGSDTIRVAPKRRASVLKFDFSSVQGSKNNPNNEQSIETKDTNPDLNG